MLRPLLTSTAIFTLLQMMGSPLGRKWVQEQGVPWLQKKLLSYLDSESTGWREQRMAEVVQAAMGAFMPILLSPNTPRTTKHGALNMLHAFDGVAKRTKITEEYGCKVPAFFVLNISDECDMGCPICYMDSRRKGSTLPSWVMDRLITEMKRDFGIHFMVISGGEPFQKKSLLFTLARLHRDVTFMVYTNGVNITPKDVSILTLLGNVFPAISLEGYEEQTDNRRGRGYFENMQKLMRALREAGVLFGFSATATRQNAEIVSSDEFIEFCISQGCKFGWYFIYVPIGRGANPDLMVTTEQRSHLSSQVFKWLTERKPIIIGDFWNGGPLVEGCIAGKYYFVVEANGLISTCVFMPVSLKDSLYDIFTGRSRYPSVKSAILTSPTFLQARANQAEISDFTSPCQIIDHPEMACAVCGQSDAQPNPKKTPPGFFDPEGEIQEFLRANAISWHNRPREQHLIGSPFEQRTAP